MTRKNSDHDQLITLAEQNKTLFINLEKTDKQLAEHIKKSNEMMERYIPEFNRLQEQFIHVCEDLPNKGFCAKQDQLYNEMHPTEGPSLVEKINKVCGDIYPHNEQSLPSKVEMMWQGYRLIKYVLGVAVVAMITGIVNLILHP